VAAMQGADMALIRLYDPRARELRIASSLGLPAEYLKQVDPLPLGEMACGVVAQTRTPVVFEDVREEPAYAAHLELARTAGYRSAYSTPLLARSGELLGTIATHFRERHRPPERQCRLVELYARQVADFIENARLHHESREATRRKDDFIATLAHELRTPAGVVLTAAHLMRQAPPEAEDIDRVERQARTMARLAEDLLDVTRVGRGTLELLPAPLDLAAVVTEAVEAMRPQVEARGIALSVAVSGGPLRLEADRMRLEQVVTNLLTNAARHTEPGGSVEVTAERDGGEAVVRVRDTGTGIPPDLLARIFEPFVQGEPPAGGPRPGLGIGLGLVRHLLELHGGSVAAKSEPGRGSEFTVRLPLPGGPHGPGPGASPAEGTAIGSPEGGVPGGDAVPVARRQVVIGNALGLHFRPAGLFARLAGRFASEVRVHCDGRSVSGKSILDLATLAAGCGTRLELEARGPDAELALAALSDLVAARFHEADEAE
jgi:phosphotransferase system HPr (HPr) family protein